MNRCFSTKGALYGADGSLDPARPVLIDALYTIYYDCRTNQTNYFAGRMGYHDWHGQWRALAALINLGAIEYVAPTGAPNTFLKAKPTKPAGGGRGAARRGEVKVKPQIRNGGNRTHGGGHGIASRGASPRDHKASTGKMARSGAGLKQLASSE